MSGAHPKFQEPGDRRGPIGKRLRPRYVAFGDVLTPIG
jgi:hypothetical protein